MGFEVNKQKQQKKVISFKTKKACNAYTNTTATWKLFYKIK